jgi:hypothetical protein
MPTPDKAPGTYKTPEAVLAMAGKCGVEVVHDETRVPRAVGAVVSKHEISVPVPEPEAKPNEPKVVRHSSPTDPNYNGSNSHLYTPGTGVTFAVEPGFADTPQPLPTDQPYFND